MRRDWLELSLGLMIALAVFGATAQAQVGFDRPAGTMPAFPCDRAIRPNAPLAVSGIHAVAPGPSPIP
jgi:hypothetical protein